MNRLLPAVALIAPALAAILLYAPSLKFGFVWDDRPLVVENPEVASANPLPLFARSFTHSWSERGLGPHAYYRPLVTMSFWLDHRLWRLNPAGYHLTNVILNALCAGLVAALAAVLLKSAWPALFAGLLFALHPAHVESVAFISGRTDLMMALFLLLALLSLVRTRNLPASATLYALALLCKEAAILFPVLAFLYLARGARRPVWRFGFALVAVAAIYLIGRGLILHGPGPTWGDVSLTQRVFLVLNAIGRYAVTALVPFRHQLSYPDLAGFAAPGWPTLAGVVALAASLYVAWRKRGSAVGLGSGLFILTILPAGNFFPPGPSYLSERLLYLPSAGAVLVVVALAARASGWRSRAAAAVGLLACLAMAVNARQRLPVWADELNLCRTMVRERPDDPAARGQLARVLAQQGKTAEAIAQLRAGLGLNPGMAELRYELASLLRASGDPVSARLELEQLTTQHPKYPDGYNLFGTVLLELGQPGVAAEALSRAKQQTPDNAMVHNNLGVALDQLGRAAEAEQQFRRALELSPKLALANNNLGEVLLRRGELPGALAQFRQALDHDPNYGLAWLNLGLALKQSGEYDQAVLMLRRAQELMPDFPGIADTLRRTQAGLLRSDMGRLRNRPR